MEIEIRTDASRTILTLKGRFVDGPDVAALQRTVDDLLERGIRELTLDLVGVTDIDSAALGQLVRAFSAVNAAGGRLKLCNLPDRIESLLSVTKLFGPLKGLEAKNFMPDPFGTRLPVLNPLIGLVLLVTLAILVAIVSRAAFSAW